jgi:predicted MFS family arabinose efflux permease
MAQIVSELGDWFYSIAVFSFLLELTGSAQMISLAFLCQVLPQVFTAPLAGVLNDRLRRKRLMISADVARAAIVLSMALVRTRGMLWLLFVLLFLETVCWAVFEPGRSAVIPNITSKEEIPAANALSATTWSLNFAIGAALGGLVDVAFGRTTVFVLNSLSFVISALLLSRMRFAEPHTQDRPRFTLRDLADASPIVEGVRYVTRDPRCMAAVLVKCGTGVMGANWVILPLMGERIFPIHRPGLSEAQAGTLGMSALMATRGFAAILGALVAGLFAGTNAARLRVTILVSLFMGAVGYVLLGRAGSLGAALAVLMIAHSGGSAAWTSSTTLLQSLTEDRFRGRVFSAEFAFAMLAISASSFTAGQFADRGAAVRSLATGTGAAMLIPALAWWAVQRLWRR